MTKLSKKQESLLNELLEDFDGDAEELLGKNGADAGQKTRLGGHAGRAQWLYQQNPTDRRWPV